METDFDIDEDAGLAGVEVIPLVSREDFLKADFEADSPIADIRWAFHALGVEGLLPSDAPSPGAWRLYHALKDDEVLQKSFYGTVYPKLLPSKAQMEKGDNRAEDGRKLFGLIDAILCEPCDAAPVLSRTERRARELAVSSTDA